MSDRTPVPEGPWTPDQPLRADATDEQMDLRLCRLMDALPHSFIAEPAFALAREFAAACVAEWRLVAAEVSLAPAGTDVSTPAAFRTAQAKYATELLDRARSPDSPGGTPLTAEDREWLKGATTRLEHAVGDWLVLPPARARRILAAHASPSSVSPLDATDVETVEAAMGEVQSLAVRAHLSVTLRRIREEVSRG